MSKHHENGICVLFAHFGLFLLLYYAYDGHNKKLAFLEKHVFPEDYKFIFATVLEKLFKGSYKQHAIAAKIVIFE